MLGATTGAAAFAPDGCEQQRKQFPENWNDTSAEKKRFIRESQRGRYYAKDRRNRRRTPNLDEPGTVLTVEYRGHY
jgi:hypothetical protein